MKSLTVVVILVLLALGLVLAGEAWADASPSPEPVTPVTKATARWVYHWHDLAVRARASANHWRSCHRKGRLAPVKHPPALGVGQQAFRAAGASYKALARKYFAEVRSLRARALRPGGYGAARWLPLARHAGWPAAQEAALVTCIWRESRGNPRATNPWTGCAGLLQIHPCWGLGASAYDPLVNLRFGLRLWRSQGWAPWGGRP